MIFVAKQDLLLAVTSQVLTQQVFSVYSGVVSLWGIGFIDFLSELNKLEL
jgi:hypothetical protein